MTPQEFSQKIKAKHPQYSSIPDEILAQRMLEKFPQYKNQVNFGEIKTEVTVKDEEEMPTPPAKAPDDLLTKASNFTDKTFGKASQILFGSTSKTVGSMIASTIKEVQEKPEEAEKLRKENITPGNIAWTAIELYPGGGFVTKALKKLPGGEVIAKSLLKLPEGLKKQAIKQYSEALGATTKELKSITGKVVPELLDRGISGGLEKIEKISEVGVEEGSKLIKLAESKIPEAAKQKVAPLLEKASKLRNRYIIEGKVLDQSAVDAVDKVVESISQFGHEIPDNTLLKIRRVLDRSVSLANKNFTKDEGLSLATEAKEGIANTIRGILNDRYKDLGKANKEFNLWNNTGKIVQATLERRSSQTGGISKQIIPAIFGGVGLAGGGGIPAIIGYFGSQKALQLLNSPAYKTLSAVQKNKLANYLISGKIKSATLYTAKLLDYIKNGLSQ